MELKRYSEMRKRNKPEHTRAATKKNSKYTNAIICTINKVEIFLCIWMAVWVRGDVLPMIIDKFVRTRLTTTYIKRSHCNLAALVRCCKEKGTRCWTIVCSIYGSLLFFSIFCFYFQCYRICQWPKHNSNMFLLLSICFHFNLKMGS